MVKKMKKLKLARPLKRYSFRALVAAPFLALAIGIYLYADHLNTGSLLQQLLVNLSASAFTVCATVVVVDYLYERHNVRSRTPSARAAATDIRGELFNIAIIFKIIFVPKPDESAASGASKITMAWSEQLAGMTDIALRDILALGETDFTSKTLDDLSTVLRVVNDSAARVKEVQNTRSYALSPESQHDIITISEKLKSSTTGLDLISVMIAHSPKKPISTNEAKASMRIIAIVKDCNALLDTVVQRDC